MEFGFGIGVGKKVGGDNVRVDLGRGPRLKIFENSMEKMEMEMCDIGSLQIMKLHARFR